MKKAYTLAEVLICVGIIGVLAAILLPLANKFKPDSNKAIYIKTYDAIVDIVKSMASNNNLYPIIDEEYNYIKAPLYNLVQVKIGGTAYGGDKAKFCQLFALNFPTVGTISCSKDAVTYSESSFDSPSFITSQGMGFIISTNTDLTTSYQTDIYFDINGNEKGNNCLYDAEKCKNPDRFKLIVSGDGHVIPADPMGIEYLKSKTNWRKSELTPDGALLTSVPDEWKVMPEAIGERTAVQEADLYPPIEYCTANDPGKYGGYYFGYKTYSGDSFISEQRKNILNMPQAYRYEMDDYQNSYPCDGGWYSVEIAKIQPKDVYKSSYDDAKQYCESQGLRLPNRNEALIILNATNSTDNTEYFPEIPPGRVNGKYWIDEQNVAINSVPKNLTLTHDLVNNEGGTGYAWCVR